MDYHYVEQLFDMVADYFRDKPPPEEHDTHGHWVKVRDGIEGAEHIIRVLTPDEFDEWTRCVDVPVRGDPQGKPVAYCAHEGVWWVIYEDTDESEVIARFEKCFQG